MYNMKEVDMIMAVENHNYRVKACEKSKKRYKTECKKMDDLVIQYHQLVNTDEKNDFAIKFIIQKNEVETSYDIMMLSIKRDGDKLFDPSMIKKNRFALINEELIQKAMSPSRLEKHLELGGDIEDF